MSFRVHVTAPGSRARTGTLTTAHGEVATPVFMPVGTRGSVRTQTLAQLLELKAMGAPILLANTYHLMVRPGPEQFERVGGLHGWTKWPGAFLTDSGGFQIFSLAGREMTEEGARFRDRAAAGPLLLTPERSIAMQRAIGSDIMMVLDQCIDSTSPHDQAKAAMELTHRWAVRSLNARAELGTAQKLFAIVQGACFPDLRRESARVLTGIEGFDGYAIGGLAVGETRAEREDTTELVTELLPPAKPRYLMGVGTPLDLIEAVHRGVDMFDCILPTAWAQYGKIFTSHGRLDLTRGVYNSAEVPLDANCDCVACTTYERSFLHHLVKAQEPLGWSLLANHNLRFYVRLMANIRAHITAGTFAAFHAAQRVTLAEGDLDNPPGPKPRTKARLPDTRGAFAVVTHTDGFSSIRHIASGETMHSVNHPDAEAERVYIAQSKLVATQRPLVVWDVGLGAAHNAMALLRARATSDLVGSVQMTSFEHDTDAFHLALAHQKSFPHLREAAPHVLAKFGKFERGDMRWDLVVGDFATTFEAQPAPDVIFWDPFSAKTDTPMWSLEMFRALVAKLAAHDRPVELFTYSASTAVRTTLLLAGFWVAAGVPSGPKESTTIAVLRPDARLADHAYLDATWLARRARSTAKFAADIPESSRPALEAQLASHPQWSRVAALPT